VKKDEVPPLPVPASAAAGTIRKPGATFHPRA
jgi:hypothetical protein